MGCGGGGGVVFRGHVDVVSRGRVDVVFRDRVVVVFRDRVVVVSPVIVLEDLPQHVHSFFVVAESLLEQLAIIGDEIGGGEEREGKFKYGGEERK